MTVNLPSNLYVEQKIVLPFSTADTILNKIELVKKRHKKIVLVLKKFNEIRART